MSTSQGTAEQSGASGQRSTGRVVVGVDDSEGAREALTWALGEAARRGASLEAITVVPVDYYWTDAYLIEEWRLDEVRAGAEARTRDLIDEVRHSASGHPHGSDVMNVPVEAVVVAGAAAEQLIGRTNPDDLLVVGSRGRGAIAGAVLGSVALRCVMHARCPVVVVPAGLRPRDVEAPPTVVVGLDGSAASRAALTRAVDEARGFDARVVVVVAVEPVGPWVDLSGVVQRGDAEAQEAARTTAVEVVDEVLRRAEQEGRPPIEVVAVAGRAAPVLADRAEGADLLVVGSRGHASLPGHLLGSVALRSVVHASTPVMVVHPVPTEE